MTDRADTLLANKNIVPANAGASGLRYFFHFFSQGSVYEDDKGEFFDGVEHGLDQAFSMASELEAEESPSHDRAVLMTDEKGREIARFVIGELGGAPHCEADYRGYKMKIEPDSMKREPDSAFWLVDASPTRADLPILGNRQMRVEAISAGKALLEARRWIDNLLNC